MTISIDGVLYGGLDAIAEGRAVQQCFRSSPALDCGTTSLSCSPHLPPHSPTPPPPAPLAVRVVDPFKASYGVDSALYAVSQLAQTTMRSELGRITLDKTFEEREALNAAIVRTINEASESWGLECLRCGGNWVACGVARSHERELRHAMARVGSRVRTRLPSLHACLT